MTRTFHRLGKLAVLVLAVALLAAACGGDDDDTESTEGEGGASATLPECLSFEDLYALVGPESQGFGNWSDANDLGEELGAANVPYPDADLEIFGPGEESGTYDSFVELALTDIAEERGQEPQTRPDYQSSPNDNVIVQGLEGADTPLGWVGYAFYVDEQEGLQAFQVDGGEGCVEPTEETIAAGEYPLARDLYIYINKAKATEKPALSAFVDYYLDDEGIAKVGEAGYVALAEEDLEATRSTWEESGLAGKGTGQLSGDIVVSGSSTVEPITARVAEAFKAANSGVNTSVEGPGTGDGFERFCAGETDVSDASRPIDEDEQAVCQEGGVEYVELKVGIDGLTVLTSPQE